MFTAVITAAWRGFGFDIGDEFKELRLGFISFAIIKGTLWKRQRILSGILDELKKENDSLREKIQSQDLCGND